MLKQGVQKALGQFGYGLNKLPKSPFPQIESVPRHVEHSVTLLGHPFRVADAASFLASYREIFVDEIYRFDTDASSPRIIDCGANYGVSVVYFKHLYPGARITAVEADPAICDLFKANLAAAGITDVDVVQKAVSDRAGTLSFHSEGADGGRTHVLDAAKAIRTVEAVLLDDLIDGPVDFLKIDIEGAESGALAACTKLDQVRQMFIEYHSFVDTAQSLDDLLALLKAQGFRYYVQTQFCAKAPLTAPHSYMGMDLQLNLFALREPG